MHSQKKGKTLGLWGPGMMANGGRGGRRTDPLILLRVLEVEGVPKDQVLFHILQDFIFSKLACCVLCPRPQDFELVCGRLSVHACMWALVRACGVSVCV